MEIASQKSDIPISGVVITFNEADNIADCIASLDFCDEVLIVDSQSTDDTVTIAESLGARVVLHPWEGFARQRIFAVQEASNQWVLMIDADERITKDLAREITAASRKNFLERSSFLIPRKTVFLGRTLRFGRSASEKLTRLFRKDGVKMDERLIHEGFDALSPPGRMHHAMLHFSYKDLHDYFTKFNRYTTLWADERISKKKFPHPVLIALRIPFDFFGCWIFRLGILDGWPGFVAAVFHTFYTFTKYAKALECRAALKNRAPEN